MECLRGNHIRQCRCCDKSGPGTVGAGHNVEFVRSSPYMSTLPTGLKLTREAAHPNLGLTFDFYNFWSGLNKFEDMDEIRPGEIRHVHFQDVPDIPRELLDQTSRIIPGDE